MIDDFFDTRIAFYETNLNENYFHLKINDDVVGEVRLEQMHLDCNRFYIHDLEIYLKYRNNGYGHILMEQIEKYAIQNNKNRLFLKVFPELTNAVKLYEDCNFEIVHNDGFVMEMEKEI